MGDLEADTGWMQQHRLDTIMICEDDATEEAKTANGRAGGVAGFAAKWDGINRRRRDELRGAVEITIATFAVASFATSTIDVATARLFPMDVGQERSSVVFLLDSFHGLVRQSCADTIDC